MRRPGPALPAAARDWVRRSRFIELDRTERSGVRSKSQLAPWTHTGMCIGMMFDSQMKSIAGIDTRTHPCDAG